MGDGLKRVAKVCGGLTVAARGETVHYDGEGRRRGVRKFQVGQRVWEFDQHRRVYPKTGGGPIFSEHFVEQRIEGIEGRRYVIDCTPNEKRFSHHITRVGFAKAERELYSDKDKADSVWAQVHRYKIHFAVERCSVDVLRKVAEVVGYQEAPDARD